MKKVKPTDWTKYDLSDKTPQQRADILTFREIINNLVEEHGNLSAVARWLDYKRPVSISHICTGQASLGAAMMSALRSKGIDIVKFFPEHQFIKTLLDASPMEAFQTDSVASGFNSVQINLLPCSVESIIDFVRNGETTNVEQLTLPIPVSLKVPESTYALRVENSNVPHPAVPTGMILLVDPSGETGSGELYIVQSNGSDTPITISGNIGFGEATLGTAFFATYEGIIL